MAMYFPEPYPDELWGSILRRALSRSRYPTKSSSKADILGSPNLSSNPFLPNKIETIVSRFPPNIDIDPDQLIDKHTLFPYCYMFTSEQRRETARQLMRKNVNPTFPRGMNSCTIFQRDKLYYCPICVRKDRNEFGEAYWHRVHQVPGVLVCPVHAVWLEADERTQYFKVYPWNFYSLESMDSSVALREIDPLDHRDSLILDISRESLWILENHQNSWSNSETCEYFLSWIQDAGYLASYKIVRNRELTNDFNDYLCGMGIKFASEFLRNPSRNDVKRLYSPRKRSRSTLLCLLFMHFLGTDLLQFKKPLSTSISHPFGCGPWPCLNPICKDYRKDVIYNVNIQKIDRKVHGKFTCGCGFIYTRYGPDKNVEDRYRFARILNFGDAWCQKLSGLWTDHGLTEKELEELMGFSYRILKGQAVKMGLQIPRKRYPHAPRKVERFSDLKILQSRVFTAKLERSQGVWLKTQAEYPELGRWFLSKMCPNEYQFLLKNCPDWFQRNSPPRLRKNDMIGREKLFQKVWLDAQAAYPNLKRAVLGKMYPRERSFLMLHCPDWYQHNSPPTHVGRIGNAKRTECFKEIWLSARAEYPHLSREELGFLYPAALRHLQRYCPNWYNKNSPPPKKSFVHHKPIDWHEKDLNIKSKLEEAYRVQMISTTQRPKRITKKGLFRGAGIINIYQTWQFYKGKLPLTKKFFQDTCEDTIGYRLRKIDWAKRNFIEQGIVPSKNQMIQLTSIKKKLLSQVLIEAIESAIRSVRDAIMSKGATMIDV